MRIKGKLLASLMVILSMTQVSAATPATSYSGFTASGTLADESFYISGRIDQPVIKASMLRNLNRSLSAHWQPNLSELSNLGSVILNESGRVAIFAELYDAPGRSDTSTENPDTYAPEGVTREEKVLGRDLLIWSESYDAKSKKLIVNNGTHPPLTLNDTYVDYVTAVTAIYKAVGSANYNAQWYMQDNPTGNLKVSDTPFVTQLDNSASIEGQNYYCDVFVTRSLPEVILNRALVEGVTTMSTADALSLGKAQIVSKSGISAGEFALYLKRALDLNGEPVYTEAETTQWLIEYGQTLPSYLPPVQLEAVKYLASRGILDTSMDFRNNITPAEMMTMLMRAKDESSRLTFKKLSVEYDQELVARGFYPTEVSTEFIDMSEPQMLIDNTLQTALPEYFDYLVEVAGTTTFQTETSRDIDALYVSSVYGQAADPLVGSEYLGIQNGFYHFRVPRDTPTKDPAFSPANEYYVTTNRTDSTVTGLRMVYGGGRYDSELQRRPFAESESSVLFDKERLEKTLNNTAAGKPLAKAQTFVYTFKVSAESAEKLLWKGKPLSEAGGEVSYTSTTGVVKISLSDTNATTALFKNLRTTSTAASYDTLPTYMSTGEGAALVSTAFFKNPKIPYRFQIQAVAKRTDGIYQITMKNNTVYVDTANRRVISGQSVTEFASSDPSPLIVPVGSVAGEYFVDTRVLPVGVANFLSVDGSNVKSLTLSNSESFVEATAMHVSGEYKTETLIVDDKGRIVLDSPYALSNYILYKKRTTTHGDFLIVLTPRGTDPINTAMNRSVNSLFGINVGDNDKAIVYNLSSTNLSVANMKMFTTTAVTYDESSGTWRYTAPKASEWNLTAYRNGGDKNNYPLPLARRIDNSNNFINFNFNVVNTVDKIPPSYLSEESKRAALGSGVAASHGLKFTPTPKVDSQPTDSRALTPAPVSVSSLLVESAKVSAEDILKHHTTNTLVYYGAAAGKLYQSSSGEEFTISFLNNTTVSISAKDEFLQFGQDPAVFVYCNTGEGTTTATALLKAVNNPLELIETTGFLNLYSWDDFLFIQSIRDAEDFITILQLLVIGVGPRLMVMDFFLLLLLSLVAPYPLSRKFCEKLFDPIKLLSFGQTDVNSASTKNLAIGTLFGSILVGMVSNLAFLELLAYFVRGFIGITSR